MIEDILARLQAAVDAKVLVRYSVAEEQPKPGVLLINVEVLPAVDHIELHLVI